MMRLIAVLLTLVLIGVCGGSEYPVGYVNGDSYIYQGNGVWSLDGSSYTRALYQQAAYSSYGVYYPAKMFYRYSPYTPPACLHAGVQSTPAYTPPALPSYSDPGWKSKILDIASAMDREAHDHAAYLQAINALGLQRNFPGYGTMPYQQGYGGYGGLSGTVTNYGATANTQYGYSYNTIAQLYGDTNLSALYQQAGQLADRSLTLGGQANSGFQTLVGAEGGNRARVAEILARGQMIREIGSALNAPGELKGYSFKFSSGGNVERIPEPNVEPEAKTANGAAFASVFAARCASCHSGANPKGKFTADSYLSAPVGTKQKVWQLLVTDDPKTMMPQGQNGAAGVRLTPAELKAFLFN
jgi:mono/diheme cytochrome c family protein